jgi:hypothetical protein
MALEPDAVESLQLARSFSFRAPWAASLREPLWIAFVKAVAAPFDYSSFALRCSTTVLSIAAMLVAAWIFERSLSRSVALLASAIVALHGLLILAAGRGLREELVMLLALALAALVIARARGPQIGLLVGALALVRWEIALLALALLVVGALARAVPRTVPPLAALAVIALAGPWLLSNRSAYGDLLIHSDQHAAFWTRIQRLQDAHVDVDEMPDASIRTEGASWPRFYLHELGPIRSVERVLSGGAGLGDDLLSRAAMPVTDRWLDRHVTARPVRALGHAANVVAPWLALLGWAAAIAGLLRSRPGGIVIASALVVVAACASYGALRALPFFDDRFVVFAVPFASVLLASGWERTGRQLAAMRR